PSGPFASYTPITWNTFTTLAASEDVSAISFNWGWGSPAAGVNTSFWSARYDGMLLAPQDGLYIFYVDGVDDGVRLYVDNNPLIDKWLAQPPTSYISDLISLTAGLHPIRVDFAQGPGGASIYLSWSSNTFPKELIDPASSSIGTPSPAPTFTSTPVSCDCPILDVLNKCSQGVIANGIRLASMQDSDAIIALLYRVEDEVLGSTPTGQRYIDLYYENGLEISGILARSPELTEEALAALQLWQPNLQALVDGDGEMAAITSGQVESVQDFLDHLSTLGSSALQQTIAGERARRPLESMSGMTMDEAWSYLNGYQIEWLPPLNTKNPYSAQQGKVVPVEFTLTDMNGEFVEDPSIELRVLDASGNVVMISTGISKNPAQGITIQGHPQGAAPKYHYNLDTSGLPKGNYTVQVFYNSTAPQEASVWQITIVGKK
ncbi:MAG: hypothetical protein HYZ23_00005, partial [Chloroflexi bacterium]|nr:hypothetical protein [Chloroflexota bacterium]